MSLASCAESVKLWSIGNTVDPINTFYPHNDSVSVVLWSRNNKVVISGGSEGNISLTDASSGKLLTALTAHKGAVGSASISMSSRYLASGGHDSTLKLWDLKKPRVVREFNHHEAAVTGVAFSAGDTHISSCDARGQIMLHSAQNGQLVASFSTEGNSAANALEYSPLRKLWVGVACDDGSVQIIDTSTREMVAAGEVRHSAPATSLAFSPINYRLLVSAGLDGKLLCFDAADHKCVKKMKAEATLTAVAFFRDGKTLATGTSDGRVLLYDLRGGDKPVTVLQAHRARVTGLAVAYESTSSAPSTVIPVSTPVISATQPPTASATARFPSADEIRVQESARVRASYPDFCMIVNRPDSSLICRLGTMSDGVLSPVGASNFASVPVSALPPKTHSRFNSAAQSATSASARTSTASLDGTPMAYDATPTTRPSTLPTRSTPNYSSADSTSALASAALATPLSTPAPVTSAISTARTSVSSARSHIQSISAVGTPSTSARTSVSSALTVPLSALSSTSAPAASDVMTASRVNASGVSSMTAPTTVPTSAPLPTPTPIQSATTAVVATTAPSQLVASPAVTTTATTAPASDTIQSSSGGVTITVIRNIVEEATTALRDAIHADIRALHMDVLRQMYELQTDVSAALARSQEANADLHEKLDRLLVQTQPTILDSTPSLPRFW